VLWLLQLFCSEGAVLHCAVTAGAAQTVTPQHGRMLLLGSSHNSTLTSSIAFLILLCNFHHCPA
jgi:hypothetical protein